MTIQTDYIERLYCEALLDLCDEKPLSKITVSDITKRAGSARQTFYNHFRDINDLISYLPITFLSSHSAGIHDTQGVRMAYTYAMEHKSFFRQLPRHSGQNNFRESFILWLEESYFARYAADVLGEEERMYRMICINLYVSGVTDVFLEWCRADLSWPLDILLKAQEDLVPDFVREDPLP